ncbi:MAG: hypothetical protein IPQ07_18180 [Myxococcales bacterium]|nr:hypothetical protein [Myxococcales bacterium]
MRRAALLLFLAACPAKKPGGPTPPPVPGVGCPSASNVYVASYVAPPQGEQGHSGWVLPLFAASAFTVEGKPGYAPIDPATAAAAGVPAAPTSVWLVPPNAPACKATIGSYYAAAIDAPTSMSYGVELGGCPAPQDPSDAVAIVLVSDAPPSECKVYPPRPIAARLGEVDKQNQWSRPTKETPIPAAFAKAIPRHTCTAPDCETLWSIAQVEVDGKPVAWSGAVNWLEIPPGSPPSAQCTWKAETFSGFFIAGPDGSPVQISDGQDHPLVLSAVLADKSGPHVLLAEGTGEYTAYDLSNGVSQIGRHLVWLHAPADAYGALDKIGPDCAP